MLSEDQVHFGAAGRASAQAGSDVGQIHETHELEGEGFEGKPAHVSIRGLQLLSNLLQRFAQHGTQIGLGLMLQLFDHGSNQLGHQPSGRPDLKGLRSPSLLPGPTFQFQIGSVSQRIEHLLGEILFIEGNPVGGGGEPFNVIRQMRPPAAHVGNGLEIGALLRGEGSERFELLDAEAHDLLETVSIDPVSRDENAGFLQPQSERAHVLAAAGNGNASFVEPETKPGEVDVFTSGLHVEHALDEVHAVTVFQDVPSKAFVESRLVMAESVKCATGSGERRVPLAYETVGAHGELGVVGEFSLVVFGSVVSIEVPLTDGRFETLPVGPVSVRQLQKDRKVDLGG